MRTLIISVACAIALSACGGVRYVYSQLDWLVPWYVRDYVTLDREQRALLDERLSARLEWHCGSQLPEYVTWLGDVGRDLGANSIDAAVLERRIDDAGGMWDELARTLTTDLAPLLATFSREQIDELFGNFDERNEKTRKEFLVGSADELQARRVERMEKRLRRWFGRLDTAQIAMVEAWASELQDATAEWFENRLIWQQRLRDVLEGRAQGEVFERELAGLLMAPDAHWSDSYRAAVEANRKRTLALLADVHGSANERQRAKLLDEVASLSRQFDRLACSTEPETLPAQARSSY